MDLSPELVGTVAAPTVGTGTILALMIRSFMSQTRKKLDKLDTRIDDLKENLTEIRIALAESGMKKTAEDVEKIKEKISRLENHAKANP